MNEINPELLKPFKSEEKYTTQTSDGMTLTHLRARVIQNRLNEVLGLDWGHRVVPVSNGRPYDVMDYDGETDVTVVVEITIGGNSREGIGTVRVDPDKDMILADWAKIAENNAMFKAANKFGIGDDLYKAVPTTRTSKNHNEPATVKQVNTLRKMVGWKISNPIRTELEKALASLDSGEVLTKGQASAIMDANQSSKKGK